jgi:hypothetical protein
MAKVLCVLYDDPVGGYPKSYARDGIPKIEIIPGGRRRRRPGRSTLRRASFWAPSQADWDCANSWRIWVTHSS